MKCTVKVIKMAASTWKKFLFEALEANRNKIKKISDEIWSHPEKSWEEKYAHAILVAFLKGEGFTVEEKYACETAFRAVFDTSNKQEGTVNACFICQYDALPGIGHASGHNLTTAASLAAALTVKQLLDEKEVKGKVTIIGAPGDDCGGGGKIKLIEKGAFDKVDFCLMALPMNFNILYPKHYRLLAVNVTYEGKPAHASAFPWEGRNALDAAVACYNNIALLRQQLKPTWCINGIISKAGEQPNVIPHEAEMKFWLRAPTAMDMVIIQQKCAACFVAAAKATNTVANFEFKDSPYEAMEQSTMLGDIYELSAKSLGMNMVAEKDSVETHIGSTDMGNVSQIVPSLCPTFEIGDAVLHSSAFHDTCGTQEAFDGAMKAAHALAITAGELICDPEKLKPITAYHRQFVRKCSSLEVLMRTRQISLSHTN